MKKKKIGFLIDFIFCRLAETTVSGSPSVTWLSRKWRQSGGVSAVAILDSSVNCVCMWSTKKLTMPAYCVAANCNNSQTTPGITMHEHFSECDFANPMEYRRHGVCFEADTMFRYSFKILPDRLKLIRLYPCGSLGLSISFVFGARVCYFAATPQSDVVDIWSRDLGVMATLLVRQKMPFFVHL